MAKVHAKIKLAKKNNTPTPTLPKAKKPANNAGDTYGPRWVAGESIRALALEAGMDWPTLQAACKKAGFFRPPVRKAK